jgi:hypothetical protein
MHDKNPDVRDGLTRRQRVVLWQLRRAQQDLGRESIPTALLYGRVVEHLSISTAEFQRILRQLGVF